MVRVGAAVVAMEVAAPALATLMFGWVALVALWVSRGPLRRLQERRAAHWEQDGPEQGGVMSGFFEAPAA